jgi:hypothetical protein
VARVAPPAAEKPKSTIPVGAGLPSALFNPIVVDRLSRVVGIDDRN